MIEAAHLSEAKRALITRYLQGKEAHSSNITTRIPRRSLSDLVPLSLYQEELWLQEQTAPGGTPFLNESITIHRRGSLDLPTLQRSLVEIFRRHEAWRTTIDLSQGGPRQLIRPAPQTISLQIVDLRGLPLEMREAAALRTGQEQAQIPFDLEEGPLVRVQPVRLGEEDYRLFFTMHQIVVDGFSVYNLLPSELATIYGAFSQGNPSPLPELPVQLGDFAIWHRQWIVRQAPRQLAYWQENLRAGLSVLRWGEGAARDLRSYRGAIQPVTFTRVLTEDLRELSRQEGVTVFMVLLAALNVVLHRYTGLEQITIGTLAPAGRKHADVQKLLGYFLNPVPLRTDLTGDITFRDLLGQARQATGAALSNDDVPMERTLRDLKPSWNRSSVAELRLMFSLAPNTPEILGWDMTPMDVNTGGSRWEFYLEMADRPGGLIGRAQYNPDIFTQSTIVQTLEDLQSVLGNAIRNPGQRLSELASSLPPRPRVTELHINHVAEAGALHRDCPRSAVSCP